MQGFRDQMAQIRTDLQSGLDQLQNVNNNAETAGEWEVLVSSIYVQMCTPCVQMLFLFQFIPVYW